MKLPEIRILLLVTIITYTLTACSSGGSVYNQINCSRGGELCITINPVEPMHFADPVTVTIGVTSSKDISDLYVTLHTSAEVTVDGPQNWEKDLSSTYYAPGLANWTFAIKAGQTLTFNRALHFPTSKGYFDVGVRVATVDQTIVGYDSFTVHTAHDGKFYKEGTPIPRYTPDVTMPAYGPGTPAPTFLSATLPWGSTRMATSLPAAMTPVPPPGMYPTPIQSVPLVATSTPRPSPYPGPSTVP